MFWTSVLVFLAMVGVDICWARYIAKVGEKKAVAAATWSALIMVFGAFTVISYTHDERLLLAAITGAWVGTWISVAFGKKE